MRHIPECSDDTFSAFHADFTVNDRTRRRTCHLLDRVRRVRYITRLVREKASRLMIGTVKR